MNFWTNIKRTFSLFLGTHSLNWIDCIDFHRSFTVIIIMETHRMLSVLCAAPIVVLSVELLGLWVDMRSWSLSAQNNKYIKYKYKVEDSHTNSLYATTGLLCAVQVQQMESKTIVLSSLKKNEFCRFFPFRINVIAFLRQHNSCTKNNAQFMLNASFALTSTPNYTVFFVSFGWLCVVHFLLLVFTFERTIKWQQQQQKNNRIHRSVIWYYSPFYVYRRTDASHFKTSTFIYIRFMCCSFFSSFVVVNTTNNTN